MKGQDMIMDSLLIEEEARLAMANAELENDIVLASKGGAKVKKAAKALEEAVGNVEAQKIALKEAVEEEKRARAQKFKQPIEDMALRYREVEFKQATLFIDTVLSLKETLKNYMEQSEANEREARELYIRLTARRDDYIPELYESELASSISRIMNMTTRHKTDTSVEYLLGAVFTPKGDNPVFTVNAFRALPLFSSQSKRRWLV